VFKVLINRTKAAIRYLRRLQAELADAQQHLVPALLLVAALAGRS
jgi:hypothetical protein